MGEFSTPELAAELVGVEAAGTSVSGAAVQPWEPPGAPLLPAERPQTSAAAALWQLLTEPAAAAAALADAPDSAAVGSAAAALVAAATAPSAAVADAVSTGLAIAAAALARTLAWVALPGVNHPPVAVEGPLAEGGSPELLWGMWRSQIAEGVGAWAGKCLFCQPCY